MKNNQTFSLTIEEYEYVWNISSFTEKTKNIIPEDWIIPPTFVNEWSWGDDNLNEHVERCLNADLNYPIIVWDNIVLDGCHRVIKALSINHKTIKAKIIKDIPPPDFINDFTSVDFKRKHSFKDMIDLIRCCV